MYTLNITCTENCETYVSNVIQTYTGAGQFISEPPAPYSANIVPIFYDMAGFDGHSGTGNSSSNNESATGTDDYGTIELMTCRLAEDTPTPFPLSSLQVDDWGDDQFYSSESFQKVTAMMAILFNNIKSIDMIAGTITVSVNLDIFWYDQLLSWDYYTAGYVGQVFIPEGWLWTPDITLINAAEDFNAGVTETDLSVYSSGLIWQSRPATISSQCMFDFSMFPFDSQTCELKFASTNYHLGQLNLEFYEVDTSFMDAPGLARSNTFWNSEYEIASIGTHREMCYTIYGYAPVLIYTITLKRYTTFYYASAILPCIAITVVALLALFIDDINARLGVAITSLLAIVAVMWSVSAFLPVTSMVTWLSALAIFCIAIVFIVCVECCVVAYLQTLKIPVPPFARAIIALGRFNHIFDDIRCPSVCSCWFLRADASGGHTSSCPDDDHSVSGSGKTMQLVSINNISRSDAINDDQATSSGPMNSNRSLGMAEDLTDEAVNREVVMMDAEKANLLSVEDELVNAEMMEKMKNRKLWVKVASAIDRISRLLFTLSFGVFLIVHYAKLM